MNFPTSQEYGMIQGTPEGVLDAGRGTIVTDIDTGRVFVKRTAGGVFTGWVYQPVTHIGTGEEPNGSVNGFVGDGYCSTNGTRRTKILGEGNNTGWI